MADYLTQPAQPSDQGGSDATDAFSVEEKAKHVVIPEAAAESIIACIGPRNPLNGTISACDQEGERHNTKYGNRVVQLFDISDATTEMWEMLDETVEFDNEAERTSFSEKVAAV